MKDSSWWKVSRRASPHTHTSLSPSPPGSPHILFLVLLGDRNIPAVGLELVLRELPEGVVLHAEGVIEHGRDVVLSADGAGMKSDSLVRLRRVMEVRGVAGGGSYSIQTRLLCSSGSVLSRSLS